MLWSWVIVRDLAKQLGKTQILKSLKCHAKEWTFYCRLWEATWSSQSDEWHHLIWIYMYIMNAHVPITQWTIISTCAWGWATFHTVQSNFHIFFYEFSVDLFLAFFISVFRSSLYIRGTFVLYIITHFTVYFANIFSQALICIFYFVSDMVFLSWKDF